MKLIRKIEQLDSSLRGGALSIGNFDGVHRGHAKIIERLKYWAGRLGGPSIVFTFDPHPVRLLRPELAPPPLTWTERKAELLAEFGVDVIIAYPTDQALLSLTHDEFFDQIICRQIGAQAIIEGPNFYFGHNRQGNVHSLAQMCQDHKMACEIVEPLDNDGTLISSTRIREAINRGEVAQAAAMLTHPYRIRGMVVHGEGRGTKLGIPTANLDAIDTLIPKIGVYAGTATVDGQQWRAAIHIGPSPTFDRQLPQVEVHLLDFDGVLYGKIVEVDFFTRLREIQQFPSIEQLKQQLARDIQQARTVSLACVQSSTLPASPNNGT